MLFLRVWISFLKVNREKNIYIVLIIEKRKVWIFLVIEVFNSSFIILRFVFIFIFELYLNDCINNIISNNGIIKIVIYLLKFMILILNFLELY